MRTFNSFDTFQFCLHKLSISKMCSLLLSSVSFIFSFDGYSVRYNCFVGALILLSNNSSSSSFSGVVSTGSLRPRFSRK